MEAAAAADERQKKLQVCHISLYHSLSLMRMLIMQKDLRDKASKKRVHQNQGEEMVEATAVAEVIDLAAAKKRAITFRNYKPYDSSLLSKAVDLRAMSEAAVMVQKVAAVVASTEDILQAELALVSQDDELNIVPKKPNWDLKSQVAAKMDKLARRTQRAVVEILREKMAAEDEETDNEAE